MSSRLPRLNKSTSPRRCQGDAIAAKRVTHSRIERAPSGRAEAPGPCGAGGSPVRRQAVVAEVVDDHGGDLQGRGGAADVAGTDAVAGGGFDRPLDGFGLVVRSEST